MTRQGSEYCTGSTSFKLHKEPVRGTLSAAAGYAGGQLSTGVQLHLEAVSLGGTRTHTASRPCKVSSCHRNQRQFMMTPSTQAELGLNTQVFSFEHTFLGALLPPSLI